MSIPQKRRILQSPVSAYASIRHELSSLSWQQHALGNFFCEKVPFSYTTGKICASKILHILAHCFSPHPSSALQWLELGAGLGFLSRHLLDVSKVEFPELHSQLKVWVSD